MRPLTKKEAEKLKTMRSGPRSRVRAEIEAMQVGDVMLLGKEEWTRATQVPNHMVRQIEAALKRKYTCERVIDGSGWVIERVE